MDEHKPPKLHPLAWSARQRLLAVVGLVILVVGVVVIALVGGDDAPDDNQVSPVGLYSVCQDDEVVDKPLSCHPNASISYPRSFLKINRSTLERCWIEVDGYAYEVGDGSGYRYPETQGVIMDLCGLDASERFKQDSVNPPAIEFLVGQVIDG